MAKAALGRTVSDVTNIRLGYVVLNDSNERLAIASMNASYRVGNKKVDDESDLQGRFEQRYAVARRTRQSR